MTPTQQDKELLTKMRMLGEKYYGNELYGEHLQYQHELQELITADRKRVALEARLDELNNVRDMDLSFVSHHRVIDRIAELKAQQEEV